MDEIEEEAYILGSKAAISKKTPEEKQKEKEDLILKHEERKRIEAAYERGYKENYTTPKQKPTRAFGDPSVSFED